MKRSWISKFAGLVLVLTLITTSLVAGTYAKYVTTVTGTGTVTVAKWQADFESAGTTTNTTTTAIAFDLFETFTDTGVDGHKLAPGTGGSFALVYDTSASEVARNVTIKLDANSVLSTLPQLKFYTDGAYTTPCAIASGVVTLLNEDFGPTADGSGTLNIYWQWPFYVDAAGDILDTADGVNAVTNAAVTLNFTATQLNTYTAP